MAHVPKTEPHEEWYPLYEPPAGKKCLVFSLRPPEPKKKVAESTARPPTEVEQMLDSMTHQILGEG